MPRTFHRQRYPRRVDPADNFAEAVALLPPSQTRVPTERQLDPLTLRLTPLREYSDDEPRDDHGRWTDGGGSSDTKSTVNQLNAGQTVSVSAADAPALVASMKDAGGPVALQNLDVQGHPNLFTTSSTPIARADMPQVTGSVGKLGDLQDELARQGIGYTMQQASPLDLHATQAELNGQAVGTIYTNFDAERAAAHTLIVSNDGSILDGHHTWAAEALNALQNPGYQVSVMRVDAPISDLLRAAYNVSNVTQTYGSGALSSRPGGG